ncbi:hypothetical protein [Sphingobium abikonense]|uniref:hypothetical protein n=1 Tax=Sphingobium abikonense TaxID=86193 RepID=UPI0007884B15|nr:hypothetical protein [Sphingobium abikonense]
MSAMTGATWAIEQHGAQGPDQLGKVWIAQPLPVGEDRLVFSGHVGNAGNGVTVSIRHGADILAIGIANPGFVIDVPARQGVYHIEMPVRQEQGRDVVCRWEVVDQERQDMALVGMVQRGVPAPGAPSGGAQALLGRMGQLFLIGDTNDSVGQFTRSGKLSESSASEWSDIFARLPGWEQQFGLEKIMLMIAPAKEEILRDHYPFRRASNTVFDDFLKRFGNGPVIMPRWELWNSRHLAYSAVDTHWTDYGATIAARTLAKRWDLPIDAFPNEFAVKQSNGDLGSKLQPATSYFGLVFCDLPPDRLVFDNEITNHGNIRVYRNASAPIAGKLLIFGDSFGTNLTEALSYGFQEVVYAYQPAGVDTNLVQLVKPTHLLLQITQRFVHGAPATDHSIFESGRKKLATMTDQERDQAKARLQAAPAEFQRLVTPLFA